MKCIDKMHMFTKRWIDKLHPVCILKSLHLIQIECNLHIDPKFFLEMLYKFYLKKLATINKVNYGYQGFCFLSFLGLQQRTINKGVVMSIFMSSYDF